MDAILDHITVDPSICHGKPCIRGTRIMVWQVLQLLANGDTADDILAAYPALAREDIQACLTFAAEMARERVLPIDVRS